MHSELRKAAVLLSSLDPQTADSLLRQIDPRQAGELRAAVAALGEVDGCEREQVAVEFLSAHNPPNASDGGALDFGRCFDSPTAGESKSLSPPGDTQRAFRLADEPDMQRLSALLEGEQPQAIALAVSQLTADRAAQIVARLPGDVQTEVLRRLADLDEAHPEVVEEIERSIQSRIAAQSSEIERRAAGLNAVSNILAAADAATSQQIRRNLVRYDAELARSLAQAPFLFSDLALLDDASLWTLLSAVEPDWVVLALAGAPPELAQRVAGLLPSDEEAEFRRALEQLGPTRLSDVEEAQQRIAQIGRRLEFEGVIQRANWRLGTVEV